MHPTFDTRIFRNECVSLARAGYRIKLCIPAEKGEVVDNVEIIPIPAPASFGNRLWKTPKQAVLMAAKLDADLYHFHDPELFYWMVEFAKQTGKPVIWDAHENFEETIVSFNSFKVKWLSIIAAFGFGRFELKMARKHFKGVVTVTGKMAERYREKGILTAVVGNFSDIGKIPYPAQVEKTQRIRFISSGYQFEQRGVLEIARAYNLLQAEGYPRLNFAGYFKSEELKSQIRANVKPALQDGLTLSGPHSWEELVLQEIPRSHVGFVLFDTSDPNNRNGLPNRFFECWSNGIPVITTAGTQVAALVELYEGGIVIPDNSPESIARAMQQFLDHPQEIARMGKNGRDAVEEKYSWNAAFENLYDLYRQVLNE